MADPLNVAAPSIPKETTLPPRIPMPQDQINLVNPERVVKPTQDANVENQARHPEESNILANMGRALFGPVLRSTGETVQLLSRLLVMVQSPDLISPHSAGWQGELGQIYVGPEQLLSALLMQDGASMLFKGEFFDILRQAVTNNPENQQIKDSIVQILKYFSSNVNTDAAKNTILQNCYKLTDYMFSEDKRNFVAYLQKLEGMLGISDQPIPSEKPGDPDTVFRQQAGALKNNLVPLLGEIVRQYNQEKGIRDAVMSIINNVVRFDKGDRALLIDAIEQFSVLLGRTGSLPDNSADGLISLMDDAMAQARQAPDPVGESIAMLISSSLEEAGSAAQLKLAQSLMFNMIHNHNPIMNVLHFVLPLHMDNKYSFAELYIDPDSSERRGNSGEKTIKLFLCVDSQEHGLLELSFWVHGKDIELSMSCPGVLVNSLGGLKEELSRIASRSGYNLGKYEVGELTRPKNVMHVFPKLITRRVGIDARV